MRVSLKSAGAKRATCLLPIGHRGFTRQGLQIPRQRHICRSPLIALFLSVLITEADSDIDGDHIVDRRLGVIYGEIVGKRFHSILGKPHSTAPLLDDKQCTEPILDWRCFELLAFRRLSLRIYEVHLYGPSLDSCSVLEINL